jgi:hypothetical protein
MKKKITAILKKLNSEYIFYTAIAFLPFENFFFAPSAGWAAITPVILAIYILFNFKPALNTLLKLKNIVLFFIAAITLGSITAFCLNVNTSDYINAFIPIILGAISLFSFCIFYDKKKDLSTVINIAVISYGICAVIGIFEYLALATNNVSFLNFLGGIFKRNYLVNDRVQFFFTEPSFIGMHLFGILLPLFWLSNRKDLLFIIGLFVVEAVAFQTGIRVIIDIAVVVALYLTYLIFKKGKASFIPFFLLVIGIAFFSVYNSNERFQKIFNQGVYADGSFASRYFRVQSSVIGYTKTPLQALVGYGVGNSLRPLQLGYDEAFEQYTSTYMREVEDLGNKVSFHDDSVSYSLYTRMISEFGLIMTIIAIVYLFKITKKSCLPQRWLYLSVILYIYVQFESLGFYALWLFIATMYYTNKDSMSERTLLSRISDNVFRKKQKSEKR